MGEKTKRYVEIKGDVCKCNYCGSILVTIKDFGQCPKGCPGNMKLVPNSEDSIYLDLKTGKFSYCVSNENIKEEIPSYSALEKRIEGLEKLLRNAIHLIKFDQERFDVLKANRSLNATKFLSNPEIKDMF